MKCPGRFLLLLLTLHLLTTLLSEDSEDSDTPLSRVRRTNNASADLNDFREVLYIVIGLVVVGIVIGLLVYIFCCGRKRPR